MFFVFVVFSLISICIHNESVSWTREGKWNEPDKNFLYSLYWCLIQLSQVFEGGFHMCPICVSAHQQNKSKIFLPYAYKTYIILSQNRQLKQLRQASAFPYCFFPPLNGGPMPCCIEITSNFATRTRKQSTWHRLVPSANEPYNLEPE